MAKSDLTAEYLREILHYDPETGVFTRLTHLGNQIRIGDKAGTINKMGYVVISIHDKDYYAHRLVSLYMTGKWPKNHIDHKNGIHSDNRYENLRDVSRSVNLQNQKKPSIRNKSGFLGVSLMPKRKKKYMAIIDVKGKPKYLGYFYTPEEAHAAYLAAKRKYHEGCTI